MSKTISCRLSELNNLIKEYENYQKDFTNKCERFVEELGRRGVAVARANLGSLEDLGNVSSYVLFSCLVNPATTDGCQAIMFGKDVMSIKQAWLTKDPNSKKEYVKTAEVSPLLMYEFGSGWNAEVLFPVSGEGVVGFGQGTFPDQTHAFDPDGWYWKGIDGVWHHVGNGSHFKGITPTHPMYHAYLEMQSSIKSVAKAIFRS